MYFEKKKGKELKINWEKKVKEKKVKRGGSKRKNHNYTFWNPKSLDWPCIGALRFRKVYWNLQMDECHEITKITKYIFLWFSNDFLGLIFVSFQFFHKEKWKVPMVSTIPNLGKCQYILIKWPFCKIHITIMQVHKTILHIHMDILQTHMTIQQIHIKTITYRGMCQV